MQTKYTAEQRAEYMKSLRARWAANKARADQDADAKAKWQAVQAEAPDARISFYGFYFTLMSMQEQGLAGLPYIDAKTFNGWRASGFMVRKGEASKIEGVTWMRGTSKKDDDDASGAGALYPKRYALFHKTQVEAMV
jgi:hypothetical protein